MSKVHDLIVVGEGITGLTCARTAAELGLRVATIEGNLFGGLVINVMELEGYERHGSGVDLASELMEANASLGVQSISATVSAIELADDLFHVQSDAGPQGARAVVLASGAALKRLGVPGELEFDHRGVSQCADCDGPMFQGEHVVVVGGGDSAYQEAKTLAGFAERVTLLMRAETPRARASFVDHVRGLANVSIRTGMVVEEILGANTVEAITVRPAGGGDASRIDCAGVFVFVGLSPNADIAPAAVARNADGYIVTGEGYQTAVRGLFAAGAVRAGYSGRLADAVTEAKAAAHQVARLLAG